MKRKGDHYVSPVTFESLLISWDFGVSQTGLSSDRSRLLPIRIETVDQTWCRPTDVQSCFQTTLSEQV